MSQEEMKLVQDLPTCTNGDGSKSPLIKHIKDKLYNAAKGIEDFETPASEVGSPTAKAQGMI